MLQKPQKKQKEELALCENEFIDFLSECVHNILEGNVPMKVSKLQKYKQLMKILKNSRLSQNKRRSCLTTREGVQLVNLIGPACVRYLEQ